ncbi:cation diffusion facilitator CzcD-associated flavoprotein CzcO [Litorivivens lipolytica]|uniref:Cation diffusion facilitator CzcD-associated flavoprotein CzcO n=1 Tax=Litorivivens lipolytica TaxID=1524264 RepID=A0A7W4W318_9GAMM|nr:NAD(P)/FAD-dependent oxidoreductase [Litorivivens lipolytica]MBB3045987.1 cation diffusion facilitator CzcD-associated flavoprotein CzcO [Litorivivens lipolytica]
MTIRSDSANGLLDTAIVGAGFGGIGLAIKLLQEGESSFRIFEKSEDVGGVWRDNIYPGAACDVPSHLYSFSFEPNPDWSRTFGGQAEIHQYLQHCADKYHLWDKIRFKATVERASFDEKASIWTLYFADGESVRARTVVFAVGALNIPAYPSIPGLDAFKGKVMHTAEWDPDYDLSGKKVGVIGTGASAIQVVPEIQPAVESLTLYQRTAPWVMPKRDGWIPPAWRKLYARFPILQKLHRIAQYWMFESTAPVMIKNNWMTRMGERLGRRYLRRMIKDPVLREKVTPRYALGCKRVLLSDDYYPALTKPNVEVLTDGIERIDETGIVSRDGRHQKLDAIVLATGFQVPAAGAPFPIEGAGGRSLNEDWRKGSEAYLGMTVTGYPNMLYIMGPNTGPGNISVIFYIESQLRYIMAYLKHLRQRNLAALDLKPSVQQQFNENIQAKMQKTTWVSGCDSWYLTEDGKNTTLWPGYSWQYRLQSKHFDPSLYDCVRLRPSVVELSADIDDRVATSA